MSRSRFRPANGFSLLELLLVLAIIGIISGIAIPAFLGQRKRARVIGDAKSNATAIALQLENRKAEAGIYAASAFSATWINGVPSSANFLPNLTLKNGTLMNYAVTVTNGGLGYTLTVTDPQRSGTPKVLTMDQSGGVVLSSTY